MSRFGFCSSTSKRVNTGEKKIHRIWKAKCFHHCLSLAAVAGGEEGSGRTSLLISGAGGRKHPVETAEKDPKRVKDSIHLIQNNVCSNSGFMLLYTSNSPHFKRGLLYNLIHYIYLTACTSFSTDYEQSTWSVYKLWRCATDETVKLVLMLSQSHSPRNISEASQQNSVASFSVSTTEVAGNLI